MITERRNETGTQIPTPAPGYSVLKVAALSTSTAYQTQASSIRAKREEDWADRRVLPSWKHAIDSAQGGGRIDDQAHPPPGPSWLGNLSAKLGRTRVRKQPVETRVGHARIRHAHRSRYVHRSCSDPSAQTCEK